jgi:hypothetical protein
MREEEEKEVKRLVGLLRCEKDDDDGEDDEEDASGEEEGRKPPAGGGIAVLSTDPAYIRRLYLNLESALLARSRADDDLGRYSKDTFKRAHSLLLQQTDIQKKTQPQPLYTQTRLARFVRATLGWRHRHLYTLQKEKRKRVHLYGEERRLVLALFERGMFM